MNELCNKIQVTGRYKPQVESVTPMEDSVVIRVGDAYRDDHWLNLILSREVLQTMLAELDGTEEVTEFTHLCTSCGTRLS